MLVTINLKRLKNIYKRHLMKRKSKREGGGREVERGRKRGREGGRETLSKTFCNPDR